MNISPFSPTPFARQALERIGQLNTSPSSKMMQRIRDFFEKTFFISYRGYSYADSAILIEATKVSAEHMTNRVLDKVPQLASYATREKKLLRHAATVLEAQNSQQTNQLAQKFRKIPIRSELPFFLFLRLFFQNLLSRKKSNWLAIQGEKIQQDRMKELDRMQIGEEIFWDQGYVCISGRKKTGHKMEWVIRKTDEEHATVEIYNTGSGLNHHYYDPDSHKHQTVFEIVGVSIQRLKSDAMQKELLSYERLKSEDEPAKKIYTDLIQKMGGRVVPHKDPKTEKQYFSKQQQAGSCEARWIFPVSKRRLSPEEFRTFKCDTHLDQFTRLYSRIRRFPTTPLHTQVALEILQKLEHEFRKRGESLPQELKKAKTVLQTKRVSFLTPETIPPTYDGIYRAIFDGNLAKADQMLLKLYQEGNSAGKKERWEVIEECGKKCERLFHEDPRRSTRARLAALVALMQRDLNEGSPRGRLCIRTNLLFKAVENHYINYYPGPLQALVIKEEKRKGSIMIDIRQEKQPRRHSRRAG